jgi:hypothetical protein
MKSNLNQQLKVDDVMGRERSRTMMVTSGKRRNGGTKTVQVNPAHLLVSTR